MSYHTASKGRGSSSGPAPAGPAPITKAEPLRTIVKDPKSKGVEITKGITIIAGDLANISKDPVYAVKKTKARSRSVVEEIPVKSVNTIKALNDYNSYIFNKTRAFTTVGTGEITYGSTLENFVYANGGPFQLKVNGDIGTQYNIVIQDVTNTKWYDFDAESFSNGFSEKIDVVGDGRLYLVIPPVSVETEYHVYFKPLGSSNYDISLPTQDKPWIINQLKDVTTTFKFSHAKGFISDQTTTITNRPNVSLTQGSTNNGEVTINITVKPLRSTLALVDSKLTNPIVSLNEVSYDGDETFNLSSINSKVSVNSTGTIGTISGTITLSKTTARDFDVLFRPTLFFKIT
tara:strand:+ start:145 stop:1182 length:1038 start_codon:yes stop_codon:yes gene_type:complete